MIVRALVRMALLACCGIVAVDGAFAQGVQGGQTGTIAGVVQSRTTGQTVPNASVAIEGASVMAMTNDGGRFRLEPVPAGRTTLVVQAPGFLDLRVPDVQIQVGGTTSLTVELEMTPNFLDHVQVTGTKTPLSVGDLAAQADIVDRATMEARGDQKLTQAIAHVPGALVSTQLGIFESVSLRGLPRSDLEFTSTLLLVDGVPQTISSNAARVTGLTINDASSIEVVRGPNSALYGRTAVAGAINLRTADPTPRPEFGVDFTGGQFETLRGAAKVSGPLKQWGGYYFSLGKEHNGGFYVNKTSADFSAGNWSAFGKLTFTPDARSFGSISVNRVVSDNSTPTNEPIINGRYLHEIEPSFDRLTNFNIPGTNYHQGEGRLTLNYTRVLSPWAKIVEVFGYRNVVWQFIDDGDFIGSPYDFDAHTLTMLPFSQKLDENILFQELRVELMPKLGTLTNSLIVGGSYERTNGSLASEFYAVGNSDGFEINYLDPVIPPRNTWDIFTGTPRQYNIGITGLFAQYIVEPAPRLVLTGAARYDRLALDNTRGSGSKLETMVDSVSPKLSATVKLLGTGGDQPTVNVYGAYSRAFLPPRRPSSLIPDDVDLKLEPEHINNYEGGLKASLLDNRLTLEATYFWMKHDGVVLTTRQGPLFFPTNAGQQRYKGVETGASVAVSPKASVYVNAAFYRNRYGTFVIQSEDGDETLTGNRLPISPDLVVNGGFRLTPFSTVDATVNIKHVGDVQANRSNTFKIDPYTLVDAAVAWRRGPVRFTLSARNIFDNEYYWLADGDTADPGSPRQVLFTTSVLFRN